MIHTSRQLKALVRNLSKGDSAKAQIIVRNYAMERFLERLSLSQYRNNLILKGGVLVAAMIGLDKRSTLDVDATLKNMPLNEASAREAVEKIISVQIDDGMGFEIKSVAPIMDEADYPGVRVMLECGQKMAGGCAILFPRCMIFRGEKAAARLLLRFVELRRLSAWLCVKDWFLLIVCRYTRGNP